jgi:uncharacterized ion transporter superfamily protein YfcC
MPPTLGLLSILLIIAALATQILTPGEFKREEKTIKKSGIDYVEYTVKEGDTLASIATSVTGDAGQAGKIISAETGRAPTSLTPGLVVKVPKSKTQTRTVVIPGSFSRVPRPQYENSFTHVADIVGQIVMAPIRGFQDKSQVIAFILLIGGAFGIILATGAIDCGLRAAVEKLGKGGLGWIVIPISMVLFSLAGAVFGMSEEVIPFVMITIPLAMRLGYDSITGLCLAFLAADLGFAGAILNPFTIGIAQGIAEIPIFSGMGFRLVIWLLLTLFGIIWTMWWGARVKKNPEISPVYEHDKKLIHKFEAADGVPHKMGPRENAVILIVFATAVLSAWGATTKGWYIEELAGLFLGAGVLAGFVGKLSMHKAANAFIKGASDLVGASLVLAFSAGIVRICQDGKILDTILNFIATSLEGTSNVIGAGLMFLFQSALNFFVPSGSGQAAMTMPIIAPLSDLMGLTRQVGVLAYQFGDGFSNMIIPTSAVTMGCLGVAEVPWEKWAKWLLPFQIFIMLFGFVALAIAVMIGYS